MVGVTDEATKESFVIGLKEGQDSSDFKVLGQVSVDDDIEIGLVYDQFDNQIQKIGKINKIVNREFEKDLIKISIISTVLTVNEDQ